MKLQIEIEMYNDAIPDPDDKRAAIRTVNNVVEGFMNRFDGEPDTRPQSGEITDNNGNVIGSFSIADPVIA